MKRFWRTAGAALGTLVALALSGTALAQDSMMGSASAFGTVLTADSEVPPTSSMATGAFSMLLSGDGKTLYYSLEVTGASSPIAAAHIHLGPSDQNGPVVANFCGASGAPACAAEGVIASGSIAASDLVGPMAGHPLSDLVAAANNGNTYANAHTANNPGGELRGQVSAMGGG